MRILIADDHALIRKGLIQILAEAFRGARVTEACDAEAAIRLILHEDWDVIITDLSMPGQTGLDLARICRDHCPRTPVLILSIHPEEQYAIRALKSGASGYLSKGSAPEELVRAVRHVLLGRKYVSPSIAEKLAMDLLLEGKERLPHELLSEREFQVFLLLARGGTVSEIAGTIALGITTVSTYRSRILTKMNLRTNVELTRYAIDHELI